MYAEVILTFSKLLNDDAQYIEINDVIDEMRCVVVLIHDGMHDNEVLLNEREVLKFHVIWYFVDIDILLVECIIVNV